MRIAIVNSKGGVGKTTSAIYLAAAAERRGLSVELLDLDIQGSASSWCEHGHPATVTAHRVGVGSLDKPSKAEVTIIDTSPANQKEIDRAAQVADYVVIPSQPGVLNDERAMATWNYLHAKGVAAAVLLVGIEARRAISANSKARFDGAAHIFETMIPRRSAIAQSANHWPANQFGYDQVFNEILEEVA